MSSMMGNGWGLGMGIMSVFGLIVIGLLVALVALLWRAAGGEEDVEARRILSMRLARGEISEDEYRRRLELLRHGPPGPA